MTNSRSAKPLKLNDLVTVNLEKLGYILMYFLFAAIHHPNPDFLFPTS